MEPEVYTIEQPEVKELYSRLAIRGFSVFFHPIFGGIMLAQNMKDINNRKAANLVVAFSVAFAVFEFILLGSIDKAPRALAYLLNFAGAGFLTEYFYKKYIPATGNIKKKSIVKPLIISFAITLPIVVLLIWAQTIAQ